jgi:hypothetical protein
LFVRDSWLEVKLKNDTAADTLFHAIAVYRSTNDILKISQTLVAEGVKSIPAGKDGRLNVFFKIDDQGAAPDADSTVTLYLLGKTPTGTYYISQQDVQWTDPRPEIVAQSGGHLFSLRMVSTTSQPATATHSLPYPIRSHLAVQTQNLTYYGALSVDNPFTQPIAVTVTQPLLVNSRPLDISGGKVTPEGIMWTAVISPLTTMHLTHTFAYDGQAGNALAMPAARLQISDPAHTRVATLTSNVMSFEPLAPLTGVGQLPSRIIDQPSLTMPITLTNRSTRDVAGVLDVEVFDIQGTSVYSATQRVAVPGARQSVVPLTLPAPTANGSYLLQVVVESDGGREEILTIPIIRTNADASALMPTLSQTPVSVGSTSDATATLSSNPASTPASGSATNASGAVGMPPGLIIGALLTAIVAVLGIVIVWRRRR